MVLPLGLTCPVCGPVSVGTSDTELHENRRDGFRLLTATCPGCGEVIACADPAVLDLAATGGSVRRQLLPPLPALTADDLLDLHELLADEAWCQQLQADTSTG